jgi:hypothetical protein
MKPGKHFNLSKTTKRVMATLLGDRMHAYKSAMIQAELAAAIQPRREKRPPGATANGL